MSKPALVNIYTDGGCNPNPGAGGWGFVFVGSNGKFFLESSGGSLNTTNNIMEMTAAIEALQLAVKHGERLAVFNEIVVHTDSKYLINGITQWVSGWERNGWKTADGKAVKNTPQWRALKNIEYSLLTRFGIRVRWNHVKGHSGVPGNERADELAAIGRKKALSGEVMRQQTSRSTPSENPTAALERANECLLRLIQRAEERFELVGDFGDLKESYFDACSVLKHTPINTRMAA